MAPKSRIIQRYDESYMELEVLSLSSLMRSERRSDEEVSG